MFKSNRGDAIRAQASQDLKRWTIERFALPDEAAVFVAEVQCGLPGCPPLETVVAFWIDGRRHQFKVFKPMRAVLQEDLPYSWQRQALEADNEAGFDCC